MLQHCRSYAKAPQLMGECLIHEYYVIGVSAITSPWYGCIIIIVSNVEKTCIVSIVDSPNVIAQISQKCHLYNSEEGSMGFMLLTLPFLQPIENLDIIVNGFCIP